MNIIAYFRHLTFEQQMKRANNHVLDNCGSESQVFKATPYLPECFPFFCGNAPLLINFVLLVGLFRMDAFCKKRGKINLKVFLQRQN